MRPVTLRLNRMAVTPKLDGKPYPEESRFKKSILDLMELLAVIEEFLQSTQNFITGTEVTIADILIYCEIKNLNALYDKDFTMNLMHLRVWF